MLLEIVRAIFQVQSITRIRVNEAHDEDGELGQKSDDYEPGRAMGTIPKRVQHSIVNFHQHQMMLFAFHQFGHWDSAENICEAAVMYMKAELHFLADVKK